MATRFYWASVVCWVLLGLGLRWQALDGTLLCDDWDHYAMYEGIYPAPRGPLDMFNFVAGDADRVALQETGRLPWWSSRELQLAVFRPLSSALLYFDYAALKADTQPWRAHLHSMFWWVALMLGTGLLFSQVLPKPTASLALLLYAVDDAHTLPVLWTANRSELAATALMVWGITAHVAYRTQRARGYLRFIAVALMVGGLFAGEYALGLLAYVFAFEVTRTSEPPLRRLRRFLPVALAVLVYLIPRQALDYAVEGSTFYVDPLREPGRFLIAAAQRMPLLVGDLMLGYAADWETWIPPWYQALSERELVPKDWLTTADLRAFQIALGALASAGGLYLLWRLRRATTEATQALRWLLLGALLSLVPLCGTVPQTRLIVGAALGFSALFAVLTRYLWHVTSSTKRGRLARASAGVVALAIVAVHGAYSAQKTATETAFQVDRSHADAGWVLRAPLSVAEIENQHVMIISGPDWASQLALPYILHWFKRVMPKSSEVLSPSPGAGASILRVGLNVIDLRPAANPRATFERSGYRRSDLPFKPGDKFSMGRYEAVVMAADRGEPTSVRFSFPMSVEDPRYVFLHPYAEGLKRLAMPEIGKTLALPQPAWPSTAIARAGARNTATRVADAAGN